MKNTNLASCLKKILKRIVKIISWGVATIFLLYLLLICIDQCWIGGQWPLYWTLRGYYFITNPKDVATAEITIDLNKDSGFVANNAKPAMWFFESGWRRYNKKQEDTLRVCISSKNGRSFEYFKVNIIDKDKKLTIDRVGRIFLYFDEDLLEREKSKTRGVDSIELCCIGEKIHIGKDLKIKDMRRKDEAINDYNRLAGEIEKFGFIKNDTEHNERLRINSRSYNFYDIYQTWEKGKYRLYLTMRYNDENKTYCIDGTVKKI